MYVLPRVNIIDREQDVLIEAELPGVPKDGVELELKDGELTLIGRVASDRPAGRAHISERANTDYKRTFAVSENAIDADKVKADMRNGVLTVTLPKTDRIKPRQIAIE